MNPTQFVVIPYDPAIYREIPSGGAAAILAAGRHVLTSRGTCVEGPLPAHNYGRVCACKETETLRKITLQAVEKREMFCRNAWTHRELWLEHNSITNYVSSMIAQAVS